MPWRYLIIVRFVDAACVLLAPLDAVGARYRLAAFNLPSGTSRAGKSAPIGGGHDGLWARPASLAQDEDNED